MCTLTSPNDESFNLNSAMAMSHQLLHNTNVGPVGNPAFPMTSFQPKNQNMDAIEHPRGMGLSQYTLRRTRHQNIFDRISTTRKTPTKEQ